MLAYVFWHWPTARSGDKEAYEAAQKGFHSRLADLRPEGFVSSWSYELSSAPWLSNTPQYEDWYLLEGSAALDTLNAAAVSPTIPASLSVPRRPATSLFFRSANVNSAHGEAAGCP